MDWINQIGGLLQQYAGQNPHQAPGSVNEDFDRVAEGAPPSAMAQGLSAAFRSDQTPPFSQMLGSLFGRSDNMQRANVLNTLLAALGPTVLANLLSRQGVYLGGLLGGNHTQISPETAEQVPAEAVEQAAAEAERRDPSIVDKLSEFYASNPTLVKTLGGAALAVALGHLASNQSGKSRGWL